MFPHISWGAFKACIFPGCFLGYYNAEDLGRGLVIYILTSIKAYASCLQMIFVFTEILQTLS